MRPPHDKLERESTFTAAVESTLANVISSCLEGQETTRKLGKVRASCVHRGLSGPLVLARAGVRSITVRREKKRGREGKERGGKKREHRHAWLYRGVNGGEHKASPRLHARPRSFTVPLFMLITSKWSQIHTALSAGGSAAVRQRSGSTCKVWAK